MRNLLIGLDKVLNWIIGGSRRHTVSAHVGQGVSERAWWALILRPLIDGVFGPNHCHEQAVKEGLLRA